MVAQIKKQYLNYLKTNNLKSSKRRDFIFDFILQKKGHFTIDDLYQKLLVIDPDIGIATIYRTIRLLVDCGILTEHTFGEKKGYFELANSHLSHHGHLICIKCGKIIEFDNELIENYQEVLKKKYNFKIQSYKFEVYGICREC
ncbi:transcriptional repressor [candidate division KSB1 bacterium]|nr:transcriptional repressor [candidate division KSB1 bacterium]MBL7094992.1 transcriptional repressor [candidate division KSB1 bacterium]